MPGYMAVDAWNGKDEVLREWYTVNCTEIWFGKLNSFNTKRCVNLY